MCVCERDRDKQRQTDRQTEEWKNIDTDRETDTDGQTEKEYVMCYSISSQTLQVLRSDLCCQAFQ